MRFIVLMVVIIVAASMIADGLSREADVALATHSADKQSSLNEQQQAILKRLDAVGDSDVSQFVNDWHKAYPKATDKALQELAIIEQRITADPTVAVTFTLAHKQKQAAEFNAAVSPILGGGAKAEKPGL